MTGTRRGRLANGENQPNTQTRAGVLNQQVIGPGTSTIVTPDWTPEIGRQPVPFDQAGYVELTPPTIKVVLSFRQSFGSTSEEREIDWPASWRLPQQGERIHLAADWGGIVSTLDFDFERSAVVIFLR